MTIASAYARERTAFLAWAAICVIWGTTYLAIKVALEGVPPLLIGGIRYLLAGTTLAAWIVARGGALPSWRLWPQWAITGGLLLGLGNGGVVVAEQWVPSGLAAVVIATTPFWMVGVERLFSGGESLSRRQWTGLVIGFGGILLLVWPDLMRGGSAGWRFAAGILALQIACAAWAVGSSISRRLRSRVSPVQTAAMQMLSGGIWMLAAGTLLGEWHAASFTVRSTQAVLYLAFVGGLAGFGAYTYALSRLPVSFVSLYAYVNPVIAVALGALFLAEPLSLRMGIAVSIVLGGTALVGGSLPATRDTALDGLPASRGRREAA